MNSLSELIQKIFDERSKDDLNTETLANALSIISETVFESERYIYELIQNSDDS